MRDTPDPTVLDWAHSIDSSDLTICVVTVEEIERGLGRLPEGRRRRDLQQRWARLLDPFVEIVAVYDVLAAQETAAVLVEAEGSGRPMSLADAQIAGICLAGGHDLATRNVKDFSSTAGLTVIDPFD
ncbi:MAG: VapC toxin family PIN domain ribonuclease [Humibacillus sp.]|nr:VapC toxin family PIN domain ribonuclease [Humibacillus sp.]MDN5778636.1 VapC toxin family PIN domain ribonuclease [Humibacillus sp.]